MGWTGSYGVTPEQARLYELSVTSGHNRVLRKSGTWYVIEPTDPERLASLGVACYKVLTTGRTGGEVCTKAVPSSWNPGEAPPEGLFRFYLAELARHGQTLAEGYEVEWAAECERTYAARKAARGQLTEGATVRFGPVTWSDGVTEDTYRVGPARTLHRASDGRRVSRPRDLLQRMARYEPASA